MNKRTLIFILCSLVMSACAGAPLEEAAAPTQTLFPYHTPTPSPQTQREQVTPPPPTAILQTPTPWVHPIQPDDTLLAIALRYGVELADLLAANPDIDPQFLTIGMEIIIPVEGELEEALSSTATPYPIPPGDVHCRQTFANELWCLTGIENQTGQWLESLAARISLYDHNGENLADSVVYAPLNLLPMQSIMPVAALFPLDEVDGWVHAEASIVSGFAANQADERYLPFSIQETNVEMSINQRSAAWEGTISLDLESGENVRASVLVTAFDDQDLVVGYRKVEVTEWNDGVEQAILTRVYSTGPEIERLEVLAEAVYILD